MSEKLDEVDNKSLDEINGSIKVPKNPAFSKR